MARILYGVTGVGLGHCSRADTLAAQLGDEHDITFVTSNGACAYLKERGRSVIPIPGFSYAFSRGKINHADTFIKNAVHTHRYLVTVSRLVRLLRRLRPDVVMTDFEPFTSLAAHLSGIPVVSVDHQSVLSRTAVAVPSGFEPPFAVARTLASLMVAHADRYLITSFFAPPVTKQHTVIVPPPVRPELLGCQGPEEGHVLVYLPYENPRKLACLCKNTPEREFVLYGPWRRAQCGNASFRTAGSDTFFGDLSCASAVLSNGGHMLMTEALYLGTPLLAVPLGGQVEQAINAHYLSFLQWGMCEECTCARAWDAFFSKEDRYRHNLSTYPREDTTAAAHAMLGAMEDVLSCKCQDDATPWKEKGGTQHTGCKVPAGTLEHTC